jgi:RHS repeat-associated protein
MQVDALGRTNSWSYETAFNFPLSFTNAAGGVTLWTYDSKGNVTTNTDAAGQVTRYGYDAAGNRTSLTDANNHTTTFGYDQYGNRTNITDALGHATGFSYDLVGRLTGRTDALNRSESFTWDDRDRLTRHVNPAGATNAWVYDGNGNRTAWTNELGFVRTYEYDPLDRLTTITLPGDGFAFQTFGYDDANNRVSVTDALNHQTKFGYDALGRLTAVTNALGNVWSFTVDAEGRRTRATDPNLHSQSFAYDAVGQLTKQIVILSEAKNLTNSFAYDNLGNLTRVVDPRSNPLTFGYDAVSRLTQITYAGGSSEKFGYDGVGNVTSITNRAGQAIVLTYDAANRLTQKSCVGTGDTITYAYDSANQLTGVVAAVTGGTSVLGFQYDAAGRLTNELQKVGQASSLSIGYEYYADGRRKKLIYPDATFITYEYNAKGWLTAIKDGGTNTIVSYEYDAAGRRTRRELENNTFTTYEYDDANQLLAVVHGRAGSPSQPLASYEYSYDAAGNRTNMIRSGMGFQPVRSESYSYDPADQLIGVTYATGGAVERIVSYFYDAAGNRTGMVEQVGSTTNTTVYTANSDNQLTNVNTTRGGITVTGYVQPGPSSNKWYASVARARSQESVVSRQNGTFSIPGVPVTGGANALTVTVTDVSGNIATQVVNVTVVNGMTSLGYDGNGNQTNDAVWSYSYDAENKLKSASNGSLTINYSYDAQGRQIERRTSGATTTTNRMYYAGWQLIAEYDGAGTLQRKYVYGPGIDEPLRMTSLQSPITDHYFHSDGLGSVTEVTDSQGLLAERYSYDVYGTPTIYDAAGSVLGTSALRNSVLFTGRLRDPDTGWYNYRHRYYSPSLGRFVQPDPIGIQGGDVNLYRCCGNNPVNGVDPLGFRSLESRAVQFFTGISQVANSYVSLHVAVVAGVAGEATLGAGAVLALKALGDAVLSANAGEGNIGGAFLPDTPEGNKQAQSLMNAPSSVLEAEGAMLGGENWQKTLGISSDLLDALDALSNPGKYGLDLVYALLNLSKDLRDYEDSSKTAPKSKKNCK